MIVGASSQGVASKSTRPAQAAPVDDGPKDTLDHGTLVSSQPLDSEAGKLARGIVRSRALPAPVVDQVAHDLTALPVNWLKRFDEENVAVVILKTGQDLGDTPLWPAFKPEACQEMLNQAAPLVEKTVKEFLAGFADIEDPHYRAYQISLAGDDLKDKFDALSVQENLGFALKVSRDTKSLNALAGESGINGEDEEQLARWKDNFLALNKGLLEDPEGQETASPKHGFYLVPFEVYKGKEYRPLTVPALKSFTGLELSRHDGGNYPENHFVAIHDTVATDPSPHKGHHRVVLHESGHMVDWLTRAMPEIGPKHEAKVAELYAKALAADAQSPPGQSPILTDRAKDTVGEFFADSVEAYLTLPVGDQADFHKGENNRIELQKRNPELFDYIDSVMKL